MIAFGIFGVSRTLYCWMCPPRFTTRTEARGFGANEVHGDGGSLALPRHTEGGGGGATEAYGGGGGQGVRRGLAHGMLVCSLSVVCLTLKTVHGCRLPVHKGMSLKRVKQAMNVHMGSSTGIEACPTDREA